MAHTPGEGEPAPGGLAAKLPFGHCPRCRAKTLYSGVITFAPRCRQCGLDFSRFNVGDGAAAFLILILGAVVGGLAIWLELAMAPPFWIHILLWLPLSLLLVVGGIRYSKARLLATEWRRNAREAGSREL